MKVLLINGSPRQNGNTALALNAIADILKEEGVDSQLLWLGNKPVQDCIACKGCSKNGGRCVFDDEANQIIDAMAVCDGLIVGTPVYFAHPSGRVQSVLDRAYYAQYNDLFAHKPAAALAIARRAGCTASVDVLNKFFTISQMPVVSSQYWNVAFGRVEGEILQDEEGMQIIRTLARNMAWMLKSIEAGKAAGITPPQPEPRAVTNFIR